MVYEFDWLCATYFISFFSDGVGVVVTILIALVCGRLVADITSNQSDEDIFSPRLDAGKSTITRSRAGSGTGHDRLSDTGRTYLTSVFQNTRQWQSRSHDNAMSCDDMRGPTRQRRILSIRWLLMIRNQWYFPIPSLLFISIPLVVLFTRRISSHHQLRCQLHDWMTLFPGIILTIDSPQLKARAVES